MTTNVRLDITRRISFADGMPFGDSGPYERLVGTASYAVDPNEPRLQDIVDLDLAPRNAQGLVEFSGDLDILKPVDISKGNKRLFYEVSNRGNRSALRSFNDAEPSADPTTAAHAGNGYLNIQLVGTWTAPPSVWGRVILWVEDVDDMYERVLWTGAQPEAPPADAPWGERYFHVRDPDGHELSFARLLPED